MSKIEWTQDTLNPVVGCNIESEGCRYCYAVLQSYRQQGMGTRAYRNVVKQAANGTLQWTGEVHTVENVLLKPLKRNKATRYFVNSMSDLFHNKVPFEFIAQVFYVMALSPQHTFQILTKRPERMEAFFTWLNQNPQALTLSEHLRTQYPHTPLKNINMPLDNVWLGVTVENPEAKSRIPILQRTPAGVRFLSCEPLVADLAMQPSELVGIDWLIIGGEAHKNARPMQPEWVEALINTAQSSEIKVFFKQWGSWGEDGVKRHKKANGFLFKGIEIREMPI